MPSKNHQDLTRVDIVNRYMDDGLEKEVVCKFI